MTTEVLVSKNQSAGDKTVLTLQAQKSLNTRTAILKATIRCFVEYGYHATTDLKISKISGLSRGAMRHHYPSRTAIIKDAIDYLHERRLAAFRHSLLDMPSGGKRVKFAIKAYSQLVDNPTFLAFSELSMAARRNPELADLLRPKQKSFNQNFFDLSLEIFPEWKNNPRELKTALRLSQYILEGLAMDFIPPSEETRNMLLQNLEDQLHALSDG